MNFFSLFVRVFVCAHVFVCPYCFSCVCVCVPSYAFVLLTWVCISIIQMFSFYLNPTFDLNVHTGYGGELTIGGVDPRRIQGGDLKRIVYAPVIPFGHTGQVSPFDKYNAPLV